MAGKNFMSIYLFEAKYQWHKTRVFSWSILPRFSFAYSFTLFMIYRSKVKRFSRWLMASVEAIRRWDLQGGCVVQALITFMQQRRCY